MTPIVGIEGSFLHSERVRYTQDSYLTVVLCCRLLHMPFLVTGTVVYVLNGSEIY
jgi:hypothetical protein